MFPPVRQLLVSAPKRLSTTVASPLGLASVMAKKVDCANTMKMFTRHHSYTAEG